MILDRGRLLSLIALLCLVSGPAWTAAWSEGRPAADLLTAGQAQALVGRALNQELRMAQDQSHPMRYKLRKTSPRITTTKDIVESRDGFVARLLSINDQPLSPTDEQKEQARLDALASDPSLQRHRKHGEDSDAEIVLKVLRMLPQAFVYQYAGPGMGPGGRVEKFTFKPNPGFSPPDLETQALTAMTGELWIDAGRERVARLTGSLQQDTSYGWGILGKLNKGGWLQIEQGPVSGQGWRLTHVQLKMSLRILIKTKIFDTDEQMRDYTPVPAGIDYREAIHLLRSGK
jgi:hypothetical protein